MWFINIYIKDFSMAISMVVSGKFTTPRKISFLVKNLPSSCPSTILAKKFFKLIFWILKILNLRNFLKKLMIYILTYLSTCSFTLCSSQIFLQVEDRVKRSVLLSGLEGTVIKFRSLDFDGSNSLDTKEISR